MSGAKVNLDRSSMEDKSSILDYGKQPRESRWFKWLVLAGCVLGAISIICMVIDYLLAVVHWGR
jgi:hypothetical protein